MSDYLTAFFYSVIKSFGRYFLSLHVLVFLTFIFTYLLPGSYLEDEFIVLEKTKSYGDFFFELGSYFKKIYHMDFGFSFINPQVKVMDIIESRLIVSLQLILPAILLVLIFSLVISFLAMRYEALRKQISKILIVGNAIPFIVIVPIFAYIFCYQLEWVRFKFQSDSFKSYLFAIFLLTLKPTMQMTEMLIHRWQEIEREFFIVTAKSKGLTRNQVLWRHSFTSLVPSFFSYANSILLLMLSGNFLLESFYSIPGIGLTFVESLGSRDLPLILACVILIGNFYFLFYGISSFLKNLFYISHGHDSGQENGYKNGHVA